MATAPSGHSGPRWCPPLTNEGFLTPIPVGGYVPALGLLQAAELLPSLGARWDVALAAASLLAIYLVFQTRGDLPEAMGFEPSDVAMLTLGAVAGQVVSLPLFPVGDAIFGINLGGAIVPLILIWRLARKGRLLLWPTGLAAVIVAAATYPAVSVEAGRGAVVGFPWFLVPPGVALAAGLVLGRADPLRAGPMAFAAGSLGVLLGADVLRLPAFFDVAHEASAGTALVIGGGGAFDLIFLSGALGLALSLGLAMAKPAPPAPIGDPELPAKRVPDPKATIAQAASLAGTSARERCLVHLARADVALSEDLTREAVDEARQALESLTRAGHPRLSSVLDARAHPEVRAGLDLLARRSRAAEEGELAWHEAADTVELAKRLSGWLWQAAPGTVRIQEGVL